MDKSTIVNCNICKKLVPENDTYDYNVCRECFLKSIQPRKILNERIKNKWIALR